MENNQNYPNSNNQNYPSSNNQNYSNVSQNNSQNQKSSFENANYPVAEPAETGVKKKKAGKKVIIIVVAILLILAIGAGAFFLINGGKDEKEPANEPQKESTETVVNDPEEVVDPIVEEESPEVHTFELFPQKEGDSYNLSTCNKIINERLSAVGIDGKATVENNKIILTLPVDFASSYEAKEKALEILTSKGEFYFGNSTLSTSDVCNDYFEKIEVKSDNKDNYLKYTTDKIDTYTKDDIDEIEGDTIYFLQMSMDSFGVAELQDAMDRSSDGCVCAYLDTEIMFSDVGAVSGSLIDVGAVVVASDENLNEIDLLPSYACGDEKIVNLLKYVIENEPIPCALDYTCIDTPVWETSGDAMGENQVAGIDGKAVVLEYGCYFYGDHSQEDIDKSVKLVKSRLDTLEIPYAFGYGKYNENNIALMISPEDVTSEMIRMFTVNSSIQVYNQYEQLSLSIDSFNITKDEDKNMCLELSFYSSYEEVMNTFKGINSYRENHNLLVEGMDKMYLVVNDVTIASADINTLSEDSVIRFSNLLCMDKKTIEKEDTAFLDFIASLNDEEYGDMPVYWPEIECTYYEE